MKCLLLSFCLVSVITVSAAAQQPASTPPADDQVVKINTNLIQIDVTVVDKHGRVVPGLAASDFEVFENGQPQKVTNFSFVSKMAAGAAVSNGQGSTEQPGDTVTRAPLKRADVIRTIAIVVDDLNLSFASIYYTRKALANFVDTQMQPGDLVAIIKTGGGVGALQQFTNDKVLLKAAIDKIRWNPFSNIDALTSVSQTDTEITDRFSRESDQLLYGKQNTVVHPHDNVDEVQKQARNSAKNANEAARAIYAQSSLHTLKYVITGMTNLPGRKAMMLFSDGIDIGDIGNNRSRSQATLSFLQGVTEAANRSSVIVYPFDPRGMQAMTIAASDNTYEIIDGHRQQKVRERERDFRDSQDGLVYLADQTGGKALINSNDLNGGIERALEEQAGYYLLGYVPDADTFDANKRKFNKLEIKLTRPGLNVSYRSGFYNNETKSDVALRLDADRQINESLMSPFAQSDIALGVNALYANDAVDGAYIRSFLHINAGDLAFTDTADGWKASTFDVAAVTFGLNGIPVDHVHTTYTIKSKGPTYDAVLKNGFVYVLMHPIKKPGVYQYRVALRDSSTGKIGTAAQVVGIPDLSKKNLTMSSVAVEDVSIPTWQLITQGKVGNGTGQTQLKSTLLYDTVLRQFGPGTVLRYGFEVYNAKPDGKSIKLETQANILQSDKVIVQGNVSKFESADLSTVPRVSGAISLGQDLKPGEYALEVTVRDPVTKQTQKQLFAFQVN